MNAEEQPIETPPNPVDAAQLFIRSRVNADQKIILFDKMTRAKESNALDQYPKLVALYEWMNGIQAMAFAGQTDFPLAPYTFDEVLLEGVTP